MLIPYPVRKPRTRTARAVNVKVSDLQPGSVITGKLGDEKKARKRVVTHVLVKDALTRFRTVDHGTSARRGGEVWELPSWRPVKGYHGKAPALGCGVGMFDRARMDDRTALVLATFAKLGEEAAA